MGYTHYWKGEIKDWAKASRDIVILLESSSVPLGDASGNGSPVISSESIGFNGLASTDDSYESFVLSQRAAFTFCKTAHRPYDSMVTAALTIAAHYGGENFEVSSDGSSDEWDEGLALARKVVPDCKSPI